MEGILVTLNVQQQAVLDLVSGAAEPSALLPFQLPAHMKTVELQQEDESHDLECHVDTENNKYDFGFGMNWKGVIIDERTAKYVKK